MEKYVKKRLDLLHLAVIIGLIVFAFLVNAQKVSAGVQKDIPYLLKVNRLYNTITVYEKGEEGNYSKPIKAIVCSVGGKGTETVLGTFQTKAKYRWKELMGKVWGQYSTRIVGGILFHSVYYYENGNPATLATREYNKLGSPASHGCIRLMVKDAKWIYDNCPVGTTVVVYDDKKSPGPLGKPEAVKLPSAVRWDPTDPSGNNPFTGKKPNISGIKNITLPWGDKVDLLKGVKAKSTVGEDITSEVIVQGNVNSYLSGKYDVIYSVADDLGRTSKKAITVTVKKSKKMPVFEGIEDRIIGENIEIDEAFALLGVKVYCSDIELNQEDIEVTIENISDNEYRITYYLNLGMEVSLTEYANIYIDTEPPIFTGVEDRILDPDQVVDKTVALSGVGATDNFTELDLEDIIVTIQDNLDGSFLVTYEVADEIGNEAKGSALFQYSLVDNWK